MFRKRHSKMYLRKKEVAHSGNGQHAPHRAAGLTFSGPRSAFRAAIAVPNAWHGSSETSAVG
eukprot:SAG11_NODE_1537_length_4724_cov_4.318270_7_plen_62_part_00